MWEINLRLNRCAQAICPYIADDTNNRPDRRLTRMHRALRPDALADGVLSWKILLRERVAHDSYQGRLFGISLVEIPAAEQGNVEGMKVSGSHDIGCRGR